MTQRIAYVTSGMGTLGTAICRRLAKDGFKVIAGCGPNSKRKQDWLDDNKKLGFDFIASEGNVANWESTVKAFEKIRAEVGEVDVLVNNSGTARNALFRDMQPQEWQAVIDTNMNSLFNVTRQVIDGMMSRGWGRIINISSLNAQIGTVGQVNYSTAKYAVRGFTRALAREVSARGVTVNTVSPGYIATSKLKTVTPVQVIDKIVQEIPVRRLGSPQEIASICAWLASDESGYATGANFSVNGGMHMS